MPNLVEFGPVVIEKKSKIEKKLQTDARTDGQTDRRMTDNRFSEKLSSAFGSVKKNSCLMI